MSYVSFYLCYAAQNLNSETPHFSPPLKIVKHPKNQRAE